MNRLISAALVLWVAFAPIHAQDRPQLERKLDSIAGAEVRAKRAIGVVAAAYKGKEKLLLQAYGQADVERNSPLRTDAVLSIGSVTKQFTAVAILQLRDAGRLSLEDEVTKWLPELNTGGNRITLRQLLAHTAGIVELGDMQELRAAQMMRNPLLTRDSVYKIISRYAPSFPAGSMESYSNTGYWLLGRIIEKASGVPYESYLETHILRPLGMSNSGYCPGVPAEKRTSAYLMRNGAPTRSPEVVHTATYSAGAICSSAADMITWLQALHGGKVLSSKSYAEMMTPARLNDGTMVRYSMGTTIAEDSHGLFYMGHNGGGFGYSSEVRWYPAEKLAIVVLTNSEPDAITKTTEDIAAAVLPASRHLPISFSEDARPFVGRFKGRGASGDMMVVVAQAGEGLTFAINGQSAEALPFLGNRTFRKRDELLMFRGASNAQQLDELRYDTGGDHFILTRTTAVAAASRPLGDLVGTFEGVQPGATITIAVESDTLRLLPTGGSKMNLIPAEGTTFFSGREGSPRTVTFNIGSDGKSMSLTLKGPGGERTLKRLS